jgi:hypothetical protein
VLSEDGEAELLESATFGLFRARLLLHAQPPAHPRLAAISRRRGPRERILKAMKPTRAAQRRPLPGSPFNVPEPPPPVEHYALRDQVTHDKYGLGVVIGVEGETAVLVDFGTHKARIALPCAKLFKL